MKSTSKPQSPFSQLSLLFYATTGFLTAFMVFTAVKTIVNSVHDISVSETLTQNSNYILPLLAGLGTGFFVYLIRRQQQERTLLIKQLSEDEDKINALFYKNRSACMIIERNSGKIISANDSALRFYGYSFKELSSFFITDITINSEQEDSIRWINSMEPDENIFNSQHKLQNGELKNVKLHCTPFTMNGIRFLYVVIQDNTNNIQRDMLDRMFKLSMDVFKEGVYWMNHENKFIYVNEAGGRAYGCPPEELINTHLSEINPNITEESLNELWYKLRNDGEFTAETIHRRADGTEYFVEIHTFYLKHEGNEYSVGYARDITKRKQIERELTRAKEIAEESERKLKISEEKLRLKLDYILTPQIKSYDFHITDIFELDLLQSIQDAFSKVTGVASIICDPEGNPITKPSNFSGVCTLIRESEEGLKRCLMSDKTIGLRGVELKKPAIEKCKSCGFYDAGAPISIGDKYVANWMIGQINDGSIDLFQLGNYAEEIGIDRERMKEEYDKIRIRSLNQFKDIVRLLWLFAQELSSVAYSNILLAKKIEEQKEYEANLLIAKNKAEESDRLKTAFLHNLSHEIRTPMNAIKGFSGLLVDSFDDKEALKEFAEIISQRSNDLLVIINDILDIAQIESGNLTITVEPCHIKSLVSEIHRFFVGEQRRLNKQHIQFEVVLKIDNEDFVFETDCVKLKQILTNLISNAFKFTDNGKIELGCVGGASGYLDFYVSDTGIGIPMDKFEAIFDRFYQHNHNRSVLYGGNGLGLSIVSGLLDALHGKIWLESKEGVGSTFYVSIPKNIPENSKPVFGKMSSEIESSAL